MKIFDRITLWSCFPFKVRIQMYLRGRLTKMMYCWSWNGHVSSFHIWKLLKANYNQKNPQKYIKNTHFTNQKYKHDKIKILFQFLKTTSHEKFKFSTQIVNYKLWESFKSKKKKHDWKQKMNINFFFKNFESKKQINDF